MPELPEVEVTRQGISPSILNKTVAKVAIHYPTLRWPIPQALHQLEGQTIQRVQRRAKYLLLETAVGTAMVHLGMSGHLRVLQTPPAAAKHDHVELF